MHRPPCLATALILVVACDAAAQMGPGRRADQPRPDGHAIVSWDARVNDPHDPSGDHRAIFARNDSTAPIAITEVHLSQCVNILAVCDTKTLPTTILAPGEARQVATFAPRDPGSSYRFAFGLSWRAAPECIGMPPGPPGADRSIARPPEASVVVIPPLPVPKRLRGKRLDIEFYVASNGTVDSVAIDGVPDGPDLKPIRAFMLTGYLFHPALNHDCPVPGTARITVTF